MLNGELDQVGKAADAQFAHQPAAISFHSFGREKENLRCVRAGLSFRNQLQYLPLADAQACQPARCMVLARVVVDDSAGDLLA